MKQDAYTRIVQSLCWEIDQLEQQLQESQEECDRLKRELSNLQDSTLGHAKSNAVMLLVASLKGSIIDPSSR